MDIEFNNAHHSGFKQPKIKVIGVGGGGGNVINRMIQEGSARVDYIAINTDAVVVDSSKANTRIVIGNQLTKGQGAGMLPEIGRRAALENHQEIKDAISGSDMLFIAAGMGGGTGTGAAPVIAEIAKEVGILTVAVVTTPFKFEGRKRYRLAREGVEKLKEHVDTIMIIPNDKLLEIANERTTIVEAFQMADDVLKQAITGLTDLINCEGTINLDFADVRTVMTNGGKAIIGTGSEQGDRRGLGAAKKAIQSPLLNDIQISGATGIIINIVADMDFTLQDAENAASYIEDHADDEANVIFGLVQDERLNGQVEITVIATGFGKSATEDGPNHVGKPLKVKDSMRKNDLRLVEGGAAASGSYADEDEEEESNFSRNNDIFGDIRKNSEKKVGSRKNAGAKKKEVPPPKPADEGEELLLNKDDITEVERKPHVPEHYQNQMQADKSTEKDLDVPSFIRRRNKFL